MTTAPCWARVEGPLGVFAEGFREELARQGYTCWAPFSLVVKWSSRAVLGDRGAAGARRCGDGRLAGVRRISHTSRPLAVA